MNCVIGMANTYITPYRATLPLNVFHSAVVLDAHTKLFNLIVYLLQTVCSDMTSLYST